MLLALLSGCALLLAQVPQGFNYQAVARDASGLPIINHSLPVRMTIQSDSLGGTIFWQELHSSVITTNQGVINLVIGKGARQSGSTVATFSAIDWNVTPKFLKIEIDYNGWKTLGVSRLWSVPYAMVARDLAGSVKSLAVEGETSSLEEALFEVKNKDGQTVFAVYNEGVRVYVSDGAKAVKGGFAVGGFGTDKEESSKYLFVGKDSVRIYLDTNPLTKKLKGGFAVGGYDLTKGIVQDYLDVNADSVRIYIDSNPGTKKVKGGFAVGGYDMTKSPPIQYLRVTGDSTRIITADTIKGFGVSNLREGNAQGYLRLTPSNYLIGHQAGKSITTGLFNSILGYQSGYAMTIGRFNSFMGFKAGYSNKSGNSNVFIGNEAGYLNDGSMNTFVGFISGRYNTTGYYNSFYGDSSGFSNTSGYCNTLIGGRAGAKNTTGEFNTFVGSQAGYSNTTGWCNVANGANALRSNTTGVWNVANGVSALANNTNGNGNVANGYLALYNSNAAFNVANGYIALHSNTTGIGNVANGAWALKSNTTGSENVADGSEALRSNTIGVENVAIGDLALANNTTGNINVGCGAAALYSNKTGEGNTAIGWRAGYYASGSDNVFIGLMAGANETGSEKLYIDNSETNYPLIWGDFRSNDIVINGALWVTRALYQHVDDGQGWHYLDDEAGNDHAEWYESTLVPSDNRFKKEINQIENAVEKIRKLTGITYYWNDDALSYFSNSVEHLYAGPQSTEKETFSLREEKRKKLYEQFSGQQIGLVAQDVEKVIPEVVHNNKDGYKQISYGNLVALLVEAVKEQQLQIESYKSQLQMLQEKVDKIEDLLAKTSDE